MKRRIFSFLVTLLILFNACKGKKDTADEKKEAFFPVLSFLRSQVADIDTSLYAVRKIIIIDSTRSDTFFIPREEVRGLAKDFLDIPDLSEKKYRKAFTEEKIYDESLNRVILSYKPVNPDKEEIQLQEVLITPDIATGDKVRNIIIDRWVINKDSSVQKRMLWQVDQSFQVATITQKAGQPETIKTIKVTWNERKEE
jgi:hypothetical protein